jgi:hypothetical protein
MRKTSFSRFTPALLLGVALAVGSPMGVALAQQPSAVDVAQARELFNQGLRLREKGDPNGALEKLKAAHALANTPITGLELGKTYELIAKLVEAREVLLSIGRLPVQPSETARSTAARTEGARLAEDLRPRIPTLTVRITGAPASAVTVSIDDAPIPSEGLEARPVNPGSHDVSARASSGNPVHASVEVKEGEARDVELKIAPASLAMQPPPTTSSLSPTTPESPSAGSGGGLSPVFFAGVGVAGAGLIAGAVTGGLAIGKASSAHSACNSTDLTCTAAGYNDVTSGRTLGNIATVSFIVAGVGAVVGVIGFIISPHNHEDSAAKGASVGPSIGLGGAGLQGTF